MAGVFDATFLILSVVIGLYPTASGKPFGQFRVVCIWKGSQHLKHPLLLRSSFRSSSVNAGPLLLAKHHMAHLDYAYAHKDWAVEDWKKVVWSDGTEINCLGSDGHKWVWKKASEGLSDRVVQGTVKFGGGSVIMWGCMTWQGVGYATKIDGRMDGDLYLQILKDELLETL